jgi:hypothetical protein
MADRVDYTKLFSEARNNVTALITTTNIPDASISAAEIRKRIYSREPDAKASGFAGYPYIIVHPAVFDPDEEGGSVDGKSKFVNWDIEIEIVTSDRGYGGKDGQGLSVMDTLSDKLFQTFMNKTNRNTLSTNAMFFSRPVSTGVTTDIINNELVFRRSIMLSFRSRIQVSE